MPLIDKIKLKFPNLSSSTKNKSYVYICINDDWLLAVGKSTSSRDEALNGNITSQKHTKAGICMMARTIKGKLNDIYYIDCDEANLISTENSVKEIVRMHFNLTNKQQGGTYIDNFSKNEDASLYLKEKLLEHHRKNGIIDFDKKCFSLNDILDFVSKDGDAWSNLISSEITKDLVEKFLLKKAG